VELLRHLIVVLVNFQNLRVFLSYSFVRDLCPYLFRLCQMHLRHHHVVVDVRRLFRQMVNQLVMDGERYGEFDVPPGRVDEGAPEFGLASLDGGRAAKPGRTEPGRAPDIGGRCPGCNFPGVLPASPGRIGLAGGRGPPPPVLNGLLPALGGRGIALGVLGASGVAEKGLLVLLGAAGVVGRATGVASSIICCNSGGKSSTLTVCFGAAFFAGAFLAGAFLAFGAVSAGTKSGNLSINLRTTGASTVEEAERTNSPTSCSLASSSLLSSPNSFANS